MNTAKTLQLLDVQSNNISPATNIESIYYEVIDGGVIYRNSLYRHFPIYVKYNNNVDDPISVDRGTSVNNTNTIKFFKETENISQDPLICDSSTVRLSNSTSEMSDILISSIKQSHLKNTRYYKLDITTYNFSDIMSLYAPKLWVQNNLSRLDVSVNNIIYDSDVIKTYYEEAGTDKPYIRVNENVGNIDKGTLGKDLDGLRVNELLDKILFKDTYPYIYDASIHMDITESVGDVPINAINITSLKNFDPNEAVELQYTITTNQGKVKIVYEKNEHPTDPSSLLKFNNSNSNIIIINELTNIGDCSMFINDIKNEIYASLPARTPNVDYNNDNKAVWDEFENGIINNIKDILVGALIDEEEIDNINWQTDFIRHMYERPLDIQYYPRKNQVKREKEINSAYVQTKLDSIFNINWIFSKHFYKMFKTAVIISTDPIHTENSIDPVHRTHFGNFIDELNYRNNVYCTYYMPYNDYNHINSTIRLTSAEGGEDIKIFTELPLLYKFVLRLPIIINNTAYYVTGIKSQYIEYLQDTTKDTIIYIPKVIDDSDIDNHKDLPELVEIGQNGIFMPANNWVIYKIYHQLSDSAKGIQGDYQGTTYAGLEHFNIYEIKAQKSYDGTVAGSKRTIKIKIKTTLKTDLIN